MESQETHPIHSFTKNEDEEVRLNVRKYNGKYYIDLRIWFQGRESKGYRPTKKGVFFSIEHFPELKKGVERLAKAAEKFRPHEEIEV